MGCGWVGGGKRERERDREGRHDIKSFREREREREGERERENSNSKTLIVKDSSVRSIWTPPSLSFQYIIYILSLCVINLSIYLYIERVSEGWGGGGGEELP